MEDFDKGARENAQAVARFFLILGNSIICPNCGTTVNTLLTNVSKEKHQK